MLKSFLVFISAACLSLSTWADGVQDSDVEAGVNSAKSAIHELQNSGSPKVLQLALNLVVANSIAALRDNGYPAEARQFEHEWQSQFSAVFSVLGTMNLGDHKPLIHWLVNFYDQLQGKLGAKVCHFLHVDDLKIFNYGIPVMIHPAGYQGEDWDEAEYGRHFVPVAGAVVYWVAREACSSAVSGVASYFCGEAAEPLRKITEKFIAPKLSNAIWVKAHGGSVPAVNLDLDQLFTDSAERLQ